MSNEEVSIILANGYAISGIALLCGVGSILFASTWATIISRKLPDFRVALGLITSIFFLATFLGGLVTIPFFLE